MTTTTSTTVTYPKPAPVFEHRTCPRCGGCGKYSFNLLDGSVCYGCNGRGWKYTTRGAAAKAFMQEKLRVTLEKIEPGMQFWGTGVTMGGQLYNRRMTVISVDLEKMTMLYRDGKETVEQHTGDQGLNFSIVRYARTQEELDALHKIALDYQDTLLANGEPRKRAKRSK